MSSNARCIAHLESGGWLLTPDLRQSRIFRRLHDRAQIAAGRVVWPSAQVMPFDGWLALQWRDAGAVLTLGWTVRRVYQRAIAVPRGASRCQVNVSVLTAK